MADALDAGDRDTLLLRAGDLAESASAAADGSDGWWWSVMGAAPVLGDDVRAVRAVSASLDEAAGGALVPLLTALVGVDHVAVDGRLDLDLVAALRPTFRDGAAALARAEEAVAGVRASRLVGPLREAAETWGLAVEEASRATADAHATLRVLPAMLGGDEPQRILLVLQSNAEIRGSGGLPGAWSLIEARDGRLEVLRQGSGGEIDGVDPAPVPTSAVEQGIWGPQLGLYFRDATMTSDFPRAAELMRAHWRAYGGAPVDGVVSVDVVTMGYLLDGLGAVSVGGIRLDGDSAAPALLNGVYEELTPAEQDAAFAAFTKAMVSGLTTREPRSTMDLLLGLGRAVSEDRVHAAWTTPEVQEQLRGSRVGGALETEATAHPLVDVTLNDATGAKMSYFLRYEVDVEAVQCGGGRQRLEGEMRLWQTVPPQKAARFDDYVTGGGRYGVPAGHQVVLVRVFGPVGGDVREVRLGERDLSTLAPISTYDDRPVTTLALQPGAGSPTVVRWAMITGDRQTGSPRVRVTPGVERGSSSASVPSACG